MKDKNSIRKSSSVKRIERAKKSLLFAPVSFALLWALYPITAEDPSVEWMMAMGVNLLLLAGASYHTTEGSKHAGHAAFLFALLGFSLSHLAGSDLVSVLGNLANFCAVLYGTTVFQEPKTQRWLEDPEAFSDAIEATLDLSDFVYDGITDHSWGTDASTGGGGDGSSGF